MYDQLTHLPNRDLLLDRLQLSMAMAHRHLSMLGVVTISLDGLQDIYARHGQATGDRFVVDMAQQMKHVLRDGDTLARISEDEFAAILIDLPDLQSCEPMIERFLAATDHPLDIEGQSLSVKAMLGITVFPQMKDVTPDLLLKQSAHARELARQNGSCRHEYFPSRA